MSTNIATKVVPTAMTGTNITHEAGDHAHEHTHADGHHQHEHKCCH